MPMTWGQKTLHQLAWAKLEGERLKWKEEVLLRKGSLDESEKWEDDRRRSEADAILKALTEDET